MMKKILLLVVVMCSILTAFGQTPRQLNEFKQVANGDGTYTWQERSNSKKLNGKYRFIEDAQTYYLLAFKDGLQHGVEECYKYNMLVSRTNYIHGFRCGVMEEYSTFGESRGKIDSKKNYNEKGQLDGKSMTYFENGNLKSVCEYSKGTPVGDEYHYFPDGKVSREFHIFEKDGKRYKSFFDRSNEYGVEFTEQYTGLLNDNWIAYKVGEYKEVWHNGQLKKQEFYSDKGEKIGIWKEWFINGNLKAEMRYDKDKYQKTYFKSGMLASESHYNNENKLTSSITYYESGKPREEIIYGDGITTTKQYYDDGKLREECIRNSEYETIKEYHRNGKLRMAKEKNRNDYGFKVTECYDDKGISVPFIQL